LVVPHGTAGPDHVERSGQENPPSTSIVDEPPRAANVSEQAKSHVANIRSQIKRNRQNERRRLSNKSVRSEIRTRTKTAAAAVDAADDDAAEAVRAAVKRIDKAAAQGVIHKNQAANRKSRLMRRTPGEA
jgi:small subunit ribosomal protein S20